MVDLTRGFDSIQVALSFGIKNTLVSELLKSRPVTNDEFINAGGNLETTAPRISIAGGINRSLPRTKDMQTIKFSSVNQQIESETNVVSFAIKNSFNQPFDRQGDILKISEAIGGNLDLRV